MYQTTLLPHTQTLLKSTALALMASGITVKPTDVMKVAKVHAHPNAVRELIDELYDNDLHIRRQITTEGIHVTFMYSRLKELPKKVVPELKFGYVSNLDLTQYNQSLYVAYTNDLSPALFNTEDKYEARNQYKALTGAKHNDVRMTKLATFILKSK